QPTGSPVAVIEGLMRSAGVQTGAAKFTLADNGTLAYIAGERDTATFRTNLFLVDRSSRKSQSLPLGPTSYRFPKLSPDGKRVAVTANDGREQFVAIYDLSDAGGTLR